VEFVRNDIAGKPGISYSWDYERDELVQEVIIKGDKVGEEWRKEIKTNRFVPEMPIVPPVRLDLITRLPIENRMKELYRYEGRGQMRRKKAVEIPKHPGPWMVVMDAIIEYVLKYDEFMKTQKREAEKKVRQEG
jgi:hypothetical protein